MPDIVILTEFPVKGLNLYNQVFNAFWLCQQAELQLIEAWCTIEVDHLTGQLFAFF